MEVHAFAGGVCVERSIACDYHPIVSSADDGVIQGIEHAILNNCVSHRVCLDVDSVDVTIGKQAPELTVSHYERVRRRREVYDVIIPTVVCATDGGDRDIVHLYRATPLGVPPHRPALGTQSIRESSCGVLLLSLVADDEVGHGRNLAG